MFAPGFGGFGYGGYGGPSFGPSFGGPMPPPMMPGSTGGFGYPGAGFVGAPAFNGPMTQFSPAATVPPVIGSTGMGPFMPTQVPQPVSPIVATKSAGAASGGLRLGDTAPDFVADSTYGRMSFHQFINGGGEGKWTILFSHPADFTPVCTTELGTAANLTKAFAGRNVQLAAISCDDVQSHVGWIEDIKASEGCSDFPFPIFADPGRDIAIELGMLDPEAKDAAGLPLTARALFIFGPDKKLKAQILYPASTGRNFDEVLRVLDSLQLTAKHSVATPVNWQHGGDCMVLPTISDADAEKKFPKGFQKKGMPSGKGYMRFTPQPNI